jgi:putative endonuclease
MTRARSTPSDIGQRAEEAAQTFLQERGLRPFRRNYRCRGGEVDLIMHDGAVLVFVEVRYRHDRRFGGAAASIDRRKQARLIHAARWFLLEHGGDPPCRIDVVAVETAADGLQFEWFKNAIEAT